MITKTKLEQLAEKYETVGFIKDDPIQFPHRFKNSQDIEIAAFLASIFAYGNRKIFIKKLDELFKIMQNKPFEYVLNFNPKTLQGFNYRFAKDVDIIEVFHILNKLYKKDGGLKALLEYGYNLDNSILTMFQTVADYFYSNVQRQAGQGFYHLIPNPKNCGAMKRMCMFLRWMVRKGPVDLGVWEFISASELLIPLDVHVARISREMGLLKRSSNDFKAVLELSETLRTFAPHDPAKFDFAIFGLGVNKND
ncbi:MAG: TIGR02757 family protein [Candidatus Gastranaerophilales bacterium]|nr:TIGR02757 family protein [Candidatus Gastranaerophilales bacterium]